MSELVPGTAPDAASPAAHHAPHEDSTHGVHDRDKNAGIVSRGIGSFIDLLVVVAILGAGYLGLVLAQLLLSVRDFSFPHIQIIFTATGFLATSVIYLGGCWAVSGRTIGSVTMGLRVVNRKGNRLRPGVALLRALLCTFFAVGLAWVVVDSRRRSVADLILRTRVIYSR
ncbi:RDD family protein [Gordonia sp. ABSL1-1]|uniref:RDD family protein n=1 Tax=Gordonia sp. ABSL1-1 TaxID=3053923 RepID=UPI002572599D|nr:RDD family protein [Gordonia sp. ABSL1-1]MDL9937971.1 RDD family protein [Gordonia sp. ABSL1-1]